MKAATNSRRSDFLSAPDVCLFRFHLPLTYLDNSFIYFHPFFFSLTQYPIKHLRGVLDTGRRRLLSLRCEPRGKRLWPPSFPLGLPPWLRMKPLGGRTGQVEAMLYRRRRAIHGVYLALLWDLHTSIEFSLIYLKPCITSCFSRPLKHLATLQLLEASFLLFDTPTSCWFPRTLPDSPSINRKSPLIRFQTIEWESSLRSPFPWCCTP